MRSIEIAREREKREGHRIYKSWPSRWRRAALCHCLRIQERQQDRDQVCSQSSYYSGPNERGGYARSKAGEAEQTVLLDLVNSVHRSTLEGADETEWDTYCCVTHLGPVRPRTCRQRGFKELLERLYAECFVAETKATLKGTPFKTCYL